RAMANAVTAAERISSPAQTPRAAKLALESQGAAVRRRFNSTAISARQPTATIPPPETLLSRPAASRVRRMYCRLACALSRATAGLGSRLGISALHSIKYKLKPAGQNRIVDLVGFF